MQPNSQRRVYGAELKAQVLAECRQPGASVSAGSLRHGLNVNLVRKWLVGRGLKRTGLVSVRDEAAVGEMASTSALQFVPLDLSAEADGVPMAAMEPEPVIQVAVSRGQTQLSVQWPASHAAACGIWLRDVLAAAR